MGVQDWAAAARPGSPNELPSKVHTCAAYTPTRRRTIGSFGFVAAIRSSFERNFCVAPATAAAAGYSEALPASDAIFDYDRRHTWHSLSETSLASQGWNAIPISKLDVHLDTSPANPHSPRQNLGGSQNSVGPRLSFSRLSRDDSARRSLEKKSGNCNWISVPPNSEAAEVSVANNLTESFPKRPLGDHSFENYAVFSNMALDRRRTWKSISSAAELKAASFDDCAKDGAKFTGSPRSLNREKLRRWSLVLRSKSTDENAALFNIGKALNLNGKEKTRLTNDSCASTDQEQSIDVGKMAAKSSVPGKGANPPKRKMLFPVGLFTGCFSSQTTTEEKNRM
ncbi:hypothetical protein CYMTET_38269 [Cymbomonas tetramitiformis]|uniref:Uncharacterized protein n=1 Tax=Cymbomonas tetramitiformis TaxID=36881 RepID=A0AAE0CEL0_9CHLO|nr:hypothetical protein CYMTET_38269 [Cymbomonas tetramitiformis]